MGNCASAGRKGRRWRGWSAWLAILALLLDALLPAGFALAASTDVSAIGFCGSGPAPAHKQLPPATPHCIYCLVAAVGPLPAQTPRLGAPRFVGVAVVPFVPCWLIDRPAPFVAARPRGPPVPA